MTQKVEMSAEELLERVREGKIAPSTRVTVGLDAPEAMRRAEDPELRAATQAMFDEWDREAAAMSDEELEAERQLFEQLHKNINETRRELGMREI